MTWPGALPPSGKVLPLSCCSITRLSSVNGTSIGTARLMRPWSIGPTRSRWPGNGQSGLVADGTMRVSACMPTVRITQSVRIFGWAAKALVGRTSSHRFGASGRGLAERDRAAHLRPLLARGELERAIVAQPVAEIADLLVHGLVEQRLDFLPDVDLKARDLHAAVGERDVAGEIRLEPPVLQHCRLRHHRDIAADVGALVERAFASGRRPCCRTCRRAAQ